MIENDHSSVGRKAFRECNRDLLQLADALRSLFRSNSHAGQIRTAAPLSEVVPYLRGASIGVRAGARREKSKVIIQRLRRLVEKVPQWIRIETVVDKKVQSWKGDTILKEAILKLNFRINFQMVRVKLGGIPNDIFKPSTVAIEKEKIVENVENKRMLSFQPSKKGIKSDLSNKRMKTLVSLKSMQNDTVMEDKIRHPVNASDKERINPVLLNYKIEKASTTSMKTILEDEDKIKYPVNTPNTFRKTSEKGRVAGHTKVKKSELRINHNVIFGHRFDDDHVPGHPDYIPTLKLNEIGDSRSANGLKRLFSAMNCGKRI